ncbi:shikimate kinase [Mangrovimicrobium sediminis]|uniref:Shikimate kinase n=1 Tax=Mangrovimicrobium sediminis TaxID=2562682 RepID=A0A4Z0M123_9GAMM|nr:shikimate kinase [Haliea sp. SAOS-164]TGD72995.1 shikimate kinase [Haliea sp. SAOS-164]
MYSDSISLIGMPGAGKSSVGVLLAKLTGLRFLDTDLDIQVREGASLEDILQGRGYRYLRQVEEAVLLEIDLNQAVIATGGSVVYSEAAMARLHALGPVVYLRADLDTLEARVASAPPRGIANDTGQGYAEVFAERTPLYERHADLTVTVDAASGQPEDVAARIVQLLSNTPRTRPDTQ